MLKTKNTYIDYIYVHTVYASHLPKLMIIKKIT